MVRNVVADDDDAVWELMMGASDGEDEDEDQVSDCEDTLLNYINVETLI